MASPASSRMAASSLLRATRTTLPKPLRQPTTASAAAGASGLFSASNSPGSTRRHYSSDLPPPPPLLQKLKADLKTAMRAKDAPRLTVLRSVLAATLNASKTATPITTDAQLIALLRKTQRGNEEASAEARQANRADLVEKEEAQIRVLEEYVAGSGVEEVTDEQLRLVVRGVVSAMTSEGEVTAGGKAKMGEVMKTLLAPGGPLEGKSVDKAQVARAVKEVVG
ncbi:Yqey-like protein-domain-containing protein [Microdochium trichocladiopsis]|uniref:Altered inheritance of mitochondria protein 41 n=1 Tax=Microdochium trichocladiopsis TaxID=1682393 RepID=A0A9P9BTZ0_9PEZI|nr:Yqey-like protein-domain-containing protein [Microdochium trichocladiopsis]KAH7030934.1 Yqey-like protein-domain-containing protein [Microdochium trichocladiopsis]